MSERDLQAMLNCLCEWCRDNKMNINMSKSNVVHFRTRSMQRSQFTFRCNDEKLEYTDNYKYLGIMFNEYIDYNVTATFVSQAAERALGLLIVKFKSLGGMPFNVFTKLYDSLVWSVISYGSAVWRTRQFTCIDRCDSKSCYAFLHGDRSIYAKSCCCR